MRASEQSSTGGVGVSEVAGLFQRIKWAPVENHDRHDLGTDLLVAVRDPRRFDRGLIVGVQVKGGPSWFTEPERDSEGQEIGWWHRNDSEHFDYWVKHQLPHLLVLYNIDDRIGYWVHVTPDRCVPTGKDLKILVPRENTICESDLPKLLDVAIQQRGSISLEGTSFDAAAMHVAPGDRLRFALLIPRLIAPHANQTNDGPLEPEEAVALLTLLHPQGLSHRLEKFTVWPDLNEPPKSTDWRWHFAHALWRYVSTQDTSTLASSYASICETRDARTDWRVASAVVLASALVEKGETAQAEAIISRELARDVAAPIDHAWLLLNAASCAERSGNLDLAKEYASKALQDLRIDSDDATASLLSGVAYRITFNLSSISDLSKDVSAVLKAGDNAGSWWRDQQLRWALDAAALDSFRRWSRDDTSRWEAEPPAQQLRPSGLMALFTADNAGWAAAESRLGRYEMQRAESADDYRSAMVRLLRSGDKESIVLAGHRMCTDGPAAVLSELSVFCTPGNMTRPLRETMLAFWGHFGDLGQEPAADEVVLWCLQEAITPHLTQGRRSVSLQHLLEAILVALPASSQSVRVAVGRGLTGITIDEIGLISFIRLAQVVEQEVPGTLDPSGLVVIAHRHTQRPEAATLLAIAARTGSTEAREELFEMSRAGNLAAAANIWLDDWVKEEDGRGIASTIVKSLTAEREMASQGRTTMGYGVDRGLLLVELCLKYSLTSDWQVLVDYLGDERVPADHKVRASMRIARDADKLTSDMRETLQAHLPGLAASKYHPGNLFDFSAPKRVATDLADYLAWSLRTPSVDAVESFVTAAFAKGGFHKRWAWEVLSHLTPEGYDLVAMQCLGDVDLAVRASCARFVARRIGNGIHSTILRHAVDKILTDEGIVLPKSFLLAISGTTSPQWVRDLIDPMRMHFSATIRGLSRRIVDSAA